uniref:Uncharacterized protein n=1 Tax=Sorghum bicolor TaxID=4558 RepID=Q9XE82_SORBI|nr:hypothetical protein [Sorghum bicolor]
MQKRPKKLPFSSSSLSWEGARPIGGNGVAHHYCSPRKICPRCSRDSGWMHEDGFASSKTIVDLAKHRFIVKEGEFVLKVGTCCNDFVHNLENNC